MLKSQTSKDKVLNTLTGNTKSNSKQISDEIFVQKFQSPSQDDQEEYPE